MPDSSTAVDGVHSARAPIVLRRGALEARLSSYGARLLQLWVPDRTGRRDDVVLGFDEVDDYAVHPDFFGATVGRHANRIRGGRFTLDGTEHTLSRNDGPNHLHGGPGGFDRRVWRVAHVEEHAVCFRLHSPDGDEGYPGAIDATATYRLVEPQVLEIEMAATTDRPTVVNMVNHSYWNLAGQGAGNVLDHQLMIAADHYLPVDPQLLPTGVVAPVAGTPFDLRQATRLGDRASGVELRVPGDPQARVPGFDHNWVLRDDAASAGVPAVEAVELTSGRRLRLWTDQPGVQLYTGSYFGRELMGKRGVPYPRHAGFTLETQGFPDAPNVATFPPTRLDPGQRYRHVMRLEFDVVG